MLSWRGGFAVNDFYVLLIASRILLYKDLPGLFFGRGQVVVATVGASTVGLEKSVDTSFFSRCEGELELFTL